MLFERVVAKSHEVEEITDEAILELDKDAEINNQMDMDSDGSHSSTP